MLSLLIAALIVALALLVLLWVGTLWGQGYFYDSPTDGLYWRAPAAAGTLALFFLLWMMFEYKRPNSTDTVFRFSTEHAVDYDRFISVRKNEEGKEEEIPFEKYNVSGNRKEFRDGAGTNWSRSSSGMMVAIILEEKDPAGGDKPVRIDLTPRWVKTESSPRSRLAASIRNSAITKKADGGSSSRTLGKVFEYRQGQFYLNLFINGLHLLVWFLCLWLLLRFQWPHALAFAAVCWLAISLGLIPELLDRARLVAEHASVPKSTLKPPVPH